MQLNSVNSKRIHVFENNNCSAEEIVSIHSKCRLSWSSILEFLTNFLNPRFGKVKVLRKLDDYSIITSFEELEDEGSYIACGADTFSSINCCKHVPHVKLMPKSAKNQFVQVEESTSAAKHIAQKKSTPQVNEIVRRQKKFHRLTDLQRAPQERSKSETNTKARHSKVEPSSSSFLTCNSSAPEVGSVPARESLSVMSQTSELYATCQMILDLMNKQSEQGRRKTRSTASQTTAMFCATVPTEDNILQIGKRKYRIICDDDTVLLPTGRYFIYKKSVETTTMSCDEENIMSVMDLANNIVGVIINSSEKCVNNCILDQNHDPDNDLASINEQLLATSITRCADSMSSKSSQLLTASKDLIQAYRDDGAHTSHKGERYNFCEKFIALKNQLGIEKKKSVMNMLKKKLREAIHFEIKLRRQSLLS